jgi:uncharacterized lipoprotein YddW (UPF0748 family)
VEEAAAGGITDLLVQVRGRGDAWFPSDQAPIAPNLQAAWRNEGDFDPLALFIKEAHARGLRVHAWLNVYLVWSKGSPPPGHVITQHPEWVAVNANGVGMDALSFRKMEAAGTEGVYLEPGNCDVVRHFLSIVDEILLRYPVDGIHLDYVRYPNDDFDYSVAALSAFRTAMLPRLSEPERHRLDSAPHPIRLVERKDTVRAVRANLPHDLVRLVGPALARSRAAPHIHPLGSNGSHSACDKG